jgi:hypothetical protein
MQRLGAKLQRIGIQSKKVNYKSNIGGRLQTRVWAIPQNNITPEAEGGEDDATHGDTDE